MRRIFFFLAAGALGLALSGGVAEAKGGHGGGRGHGHGGSHGHRGYHKTHGHRYSGGYYYRGRHHNHWGSRVWNTQYSRYHYYDTGLRTYYYYVPTSDCYYPCP